jgi:hypothetical protein
VAWDVVKQRGCEGLVAKDDQSPYRPGPTRSWLKLKVRHEGVLTVGGRLGTPEAWEGVLVGERVGRRLLYRGVVAELLERCPVRPTAPFQDPPKGRRIIWLEPRVRIELTYNELMEGRLRDPVFRGIASSSRGGPLSNGPTSQSPFRTIRRRPLSGGSGPEPIPSWNMENQRDQRGNPICPSCGQAILPVLPDRDPWQDEGEGG